MNILRLSTLSLTIILFSLGALMLPVNTTLAHHCKGGHAGSPGCPPTTNGKDVATYSVAITGAVLGGSGADHWREGFVGKNSIGLNVPGGPFTAENSVGQLTNLSFFTKPFPNGPFSGSRGENCFGTTDAFLGQAILKKGKRGRAEGHLGFSGLTDDGTMTEVQYRLSVVGSFDGDWPPSNPLNPTDMIMDTWEMSAGESGFIQNISCEGDGDFDIDDDNNTLPNEVVITVTLVE